MAESGEQGNDPTAEEDEEEDDTESEESEEVEPKLKYERIGNDLTSILNKDAASCMAVHPKFLALGTHWGMIHILDHSGYNIRSKELPAHTTTVNQISIDDNGDYIASCSDDGKVVINGLYSTENNQMINFDRPIKAVSMDPFFYKSGSGKHFVTGDNKLVLNEKGFLSRHKSYVLHQGEGPIRNIKWRSHFIAWANDYGVKVYDMSSKKRITFIARENTSVRPEMYRCNLCWRDDTSLLIGWANSIKVCLVKERLVDDVRDLPNRYVEIVAMFHTDFMISGLCPYGENLAVLSHEEEETTGEATKPVAARPHLRIIEPNMDFYDELSNDALSIRGYQDYRCNDYHLEALDSDHYYFIVSPKDVVVARQRDQDDHVSWLLEHDRFVEAMAVASSHCKDLKKHSYQEIGRQYLQYLLDERDFDEAGRLCVKILGKSRDLWETEVYKFAQIHQLRAIAPYLPRREPTLSPGIYEMVLNDFLQTDHVGFSQLVQEWPSDLYNIPTLVNAVQDKLDRDRNNPILLRCLANLYTNDKRYDKALGIYLKLRHPDVFVLIHKHNLFDSITDKIVLLMEFEAEQAVKMLLENTDKVPVEKVVQQLEHKPEMLHRYLDQLYQKDPHLGADYHPLQVGLYAEFDPARLLGFLRSSNYYPLEKALEECRQRSLIPEMVFLLGRMGNRKQALHLITHDLHDVSQAIDFCKEHSDAELWDDLINYSIDKPTFITGLLQNIGTDVDPIILIQKIRQGMEIPGLRDSLVKILKDYDLQISLREGCRRILVSDTFGLMRRLVNQQKHGICVSEQTVCNACHENIIIHDLRFAGSIAVFFCKHTFHEDCLPAHNMTSCMICSAQRRGPGTVNSARK